MTLELRGEQAAPCTPRARRTGRARATDSALAAQLELEAWACESSGALDRRLTGTGSCGPPAEPASFKLKPGASDPLAGPGLKGSGPLQAASSATVRPLTITHSPRSCLVPARTHAPQSA
eukprot:174270-Rhodomonas_salina.1